MICLDTNYLVCALVSGTQEANEVEFWWRRGEKLFASSVAWYEFLCGPVTTEEILLVRSFLSGGIIAFEEAQAATAARLFNAVGRERRLRVDAMIAASAINEGCLLATSNRADFNVFVPFGLALS